MKKNHGGCLGDLLGMTNYPGITSFSTGAMNKHPGCLGDIGDYTIQLCGDYFINHEIGIPIKQLVFHGK